MDEQQNTKKPTDLPESPASVNTRIRTPDGFVVQWTMRDESNKNLLFKLKTMIKYWRDEGYTPVEDYRTAKSSATPSPDVVPTKPCTIHQVVMKQKISKTSGKSYFSHWEGKYPALGNQCFGQGYVNSQGNMFPGQDQNRPHSSPQSLSGQDFTGDIDI